MSGDRNSNARCPHAFDLAAADGAAADQSDRAAAELPFIAYALPDGVQQAIVPAPAGREWMRRTHKGFAHRCLPLLMANQSGWFLLNEYTFQVTWDGGPLATALKFDYPGERPRRRAAGSQFGNGILTFAVGYLFRTPPGYNLAISGPTNLPKDGISPLAGVVETDWAVATFTMNWKLTRPNHPVTFTAGEPICLIVPQRRHELERFTPTIRKIDEDPELAVQWREFERRRELMLGLRRFAYAKAGSAGSDSVPWERHYFEGTSPGGWSAAEHQKKLTLHEFEDRSQGLAEPDQKAPGRQEAV